MNRLTLIHDTLYDVKYNLMRIKKFDKRSDMKLFYSLDLENNDDISF